MTQMMAQVNGMQEELREGTSLAELIERRGAPPSGVAVALNGDVVRRADWPATVLEDGAVVEVLTAVQGG